MKFSPAKFALAVAVGAAALPAAAAEQVAIGVPNWTTAQVNANLLAAVVEERIGGEADLVPGTNATIFQAMDQGKGDIDVHPDVWLPNQETFVKKYVEEKGTVRLSEHYYVGDQGFCVPKDFAAKFDITHIADLGRPEVAAAMDSDGDGKGEIWIGAPGWASANVNEVKVRDYGLLDFLEPVRAEESVRNARIREAIEKGEGYAFYCYKPHAIWYMFDIVMLEEPPYDPEKYVAYQPSDRPDWYEASYIASKDAPRHVHVAWSVALEQRSPAIAEFLQRFSITADDVSFLAWQVAGKGRDPAEVAREWIAEHPDRVDAWLGL